MRQAGALICSIPSHASSLSLNWYTSSNSTSKTVHREINRSHLYIYSVCVCVPDHLRRALFRRDKQVQCAAGGTRLQPTLWQHLTLRPELSSCFLLVETWNLEPSINPGLSSHEWPVFSFSCICSLTTTPFKFQLRGTRAVWQLQRWIHCHLDHNRVCSNAGSKCSWSKNTSVYSVFLFKWGPRLN